MQAIELVTNRTTRAPATALVKAVRERGLANGLILLNCGPDGNALRLLPPLTISDDLLTEGLDLLEETLRQATKSL